MLFMANDVPIKSCVLSQESLALLRKDWRGVT
jgi:hypothetical protein